MATIIRQRTSNPNAQQVTLAASDAAKIAYIDTKAYGEKNTAGETNKLAGQAYARFQYLGNVFTSRDAAFLDAVQGRQLSAVTFSVTEESLTDAEVAEGKAPRQYLEVLSYDLFDVAAARLEAEAKLADAETAAILAMARRAAARRDAALAAAARPAATASAVTASAAPAAVTPAPAA